MKKISLSMLMLSAACVCFAQNKDFLWPIVGQKTGANILYKPQDYIGKELNLDNLIIFAPEGSSVQSPADGELYLYKYSYLKSIDYGTLFGLAPMNYESDANTLLASDFSEKDDITYLSVIFRLKLSDGKLLSISGLRPTQTFKSGQKINKGDLIGTVGYFYKAISKPSISVSLSEHGKAIDPMSLFGLKTTFRNADEKKKEVLLKDEALTDLRILVEALKEGYPGLSDYLSEKECNDVFSWASTSIYNSISISEFYKILNVLIHAFRDNHLAIVSSLPIEDKTVYLTSVSFGWHNDTLIVTRTLAPESHYYKRKIRAVDGISADSLKTKIMPYIENIEGNVASYKDFALKTLATLRYFNYLPEASPKRDLSLTFETGETVFFPGYEYEPKVCKNLLPLWMAFYAINRESLVLKKITNKTTYMGIHSFDLNETQLEHIAEFIRDMSASNDSHLIIDVRNNPGGSEELAKQLFSYIAQQPFQLSMYCQVNKKGGFNFFKYCSNYLPDQEDIFSEYSDQKGQRGFFLDTNHEISPNDSVNFKGRVYVLTNERSFSASAQFAALVHKYRRGVIVGRETGSAYHQMNALKMAYLRLPHSNMVVHIPLVKSVFDTCVGRIPFGRGVLPDYELPLSLEELSFENGDAILNYSLSLIQNGDYLPKTPLERDANWPTYLAILIGSIIVCFVLKLGGAHH